MLNHHEMFSSQIENQTPAQEWKVQGNQAQCYSSVYRFKDIEYVIQLAQRVTQPFLDNSLYRFENQYYLIIFFPENRLLRGRDWFESLILEYGERSHLTTHRLREYGNQIMEQNALANVKNYFYALS